MTVEPTRFARSAVLLGSAIFVGAATGCSPQGATTTSTITSTTTSVAPSSLGPHLTAMSTPRTGLVGRTTINATASLSNVSASLRGTIEFDIHLGAGSQGQPAFSSATPFSGPGNYKMPNGFMPHAPGTYYVSMITINTSDNSSYQVSPFGNPNLTTTITG
jgi:hypothetical protein